MLTIPQEFPSQTQIAVAVIGSLDEGSRILQTLPVSRRLNARVWQGSDFMSPESVLALDQDPSPIDVGQAVILVRDHPSLPFKVHSRQSLSN